MALSSSSTFVETETEYKDTASYRINESASEARRHAVAIRFLLLLLPNSATKGSNTVGYDMGLLRGELAEADDYANALENVFSIWGDQEDPLLSDYFNSAADFDWIKALGKVGTNSVLQQEEPLSYTFLDDGNWL